MRNAAVFSSLVVALLAGAPQTPARADGCYVPERSIAALPGIPVQRALVVFRDGRETLLVESALEGQGRRFAWIVPVPARPEVVAAAGPGALNSLAMGVQPRIVDVPESLSPVFLALVLGAIVLAALFVWGAARRHNVPRWLSAICAVLTFLGGIPFGAIGYVFLILLYGYGPVGAVEPPSGAAVPGVRVLEYSRVGSYEVAVLSADDSRALYSWLEAEGLAAPEVLRPAVDDYARSGWCFVTARLATDGGGRALSHPLRIGFRTERAVYPMRLTALSGADLALELYVAGCEAASAPGTERVFCDRFGKAESTLATYGTASFLRGENRGLLVGAGSGLGLGHPDLQALLWDGCWLSKLTGTLKPEAMKDDMYIAWSAPGFEQRTFFTRVARLNAGWTAFIAVFVAGLAVVLIGWGMRRIDRRGALKIALSAALIGVAAFVVLQFALPGVAATRHGGKHGGRHGRSPGGIEDVAGELAGAGQRIKSRETLPEVEAKVLREKAAGWSNLYTGEPMREEDSPGNFTIQAAGEKLVFTFYDLGGTPIDVEMTPGGRGR